MEEDTSSDPIGGLQWLADDSATDSKSRKRQRTGKIDQFTDIASAEARTILRFVAVVDVARLNPFWGYGVRANRALVESHVSALITTFTEKGIRRFDTDTRLRVAVPKQFLDAIMEDMDENNRSKARNFSATTITEYPVIDIGRFVEQGAVLRLEAGQHRRAAIMRMNGFRVADMVGTFVNDQREICERSTMWAVEFYEQELLDTKPLVRNSITRNEIDITRPSNGGDLFCRFQEVWNALSSDERRDVKSSHANFNKFLAAIFGPDASHNEKLYPIIKHGAWNDYCIRLCCSIPWGRQRIVLGKLSSAISSHIPRVRYPLVFYPLDGQQLWFEKVIGLAAERISPADTDLLTKESQHFTGVRLRPLFFPVLAEFQLDRQKNTLNGKTVYLDVDWMLSNPGAQPAWPRLATPFRIDEDHLYLFRRPEFLDNLDDKEYIDLYQHLLSDEVD
ncbi:hypothetical protein NFIA_024070 [Paecilomyces variotii No. 5]|uniref:Uncharacterized protein n=1 Tax=Byssochlamys spectabilis (strain No. 5 / NBRC 109023) TaxID=1356009 RepID=V5FC31_BYSSN|nr:hypothetical protein NFIA_024070 [Paecilomyces variotii No. 5]